MFRFLNDPDDDDIYDDDMMVTLNKRSGFRNEIDDVIAC